MASSSMLSQQNIITTFIFGAFMFFAAWTFVALTYRDDTFGLWKAKHFTYPVQKNIERKLFYVLHRISAVAWTLLISVHLLILFLTRRRLVTMVGKVSIPVHDILGWAVLGCDVANIVTGVVTLAIQPFTDRWSTVFVSINAFFNVVLIIIFLLSRFDFLVPRRWHRYIGFGFLVSVLGFLIQSNLFFTMIYASSKDIMAKWHLALGLALPVSVVATAVVAVIYEFGFARKKATGDAPEETPETKTKDAVTAAPVKNSVVV